MVKSFVVIVVDGIIMIMIIPLYTLRNIFVNFRVLEGRNGQVDIVAGNNSTTYEATEDPTIRGGEMYPKRQGTRRSGSREKSVLVVV